VTDFKKDLLVDFDGVLHSYTSGWQGIDNIPDPPVDGAMRFLETAVYYFNVHIYSSRSQSPRGIRAMQYYLLKHLDEELPAGRGLCVFDLLQFPDKKPAAFLTIDDRAFCFEGIFPPIEKLLEFKPWNRRPS